MSDRFELVKSWYNIANEDLLTAQHLFRYEDPVLRSICFHCQQAVEKYIKALIIFYDGDFSFTHDISRLLIELKEYTSDINFDDLNLERLTVYAVETRYPDTESIITIEKAKEAIGIAFEVKQRLTGVIL